MLPMRRPTHYGKITRREGRGRGMSERSTRQLAPTTYWIRWSRISRSTSPSHSPETQQHCRRAPQWERLKSRPVEARLMPEWERAGRLGPDQAQLHCTLQFPQATPERAAEHDESTSPPFQLGKKFAGGLEHRIKTLLLSSFGRGGSSFVFKRFTVLPLLCHSRV